MWKKDSTVDTILKRVSMIVYIPCDPPTQSGLTPILSRAKEVTISGIGTANKQSCSQEWTPPCGKQKRCQSDRSVRLKIANKQRNKGSVMTGSKVHGYDCMRSEPC